MAMDVAMSEQGHLRSVQDAVRSGNAKTIISWVEAQRREEQSSLTQAITKELLRNASESTEFSGHSCVPLCGFLQHYMKSQHRTSREWMFNKALALDLYKFYVEGLQSLNVFLTKKLVGIDDLAQAFREVEPSAGSAGEVDSWRALIARLFSWMAFSNLCPITGKVIIQLYSEMAKVAKTVQPGTTCDVFSVVHFKGWLLDASVEHPDILEDIRHYVLTPLFKSDKTSALELLCLFNSRLESLASAGPGLDTALLLQLAVLQTGKKTGLVSDPDEIASEQSSSRMALQTTVLDGLLTHPSHEIRASAFSLLVSSQTTTKPLSTAVMQLLKLHLPAIYTWTRLVLDLVMDPFTDVRETAVTVLSMLPAGLVTTQQRNLGAPYTLHCVLEEMCARAQDLATQTGRADYGDGAARAHGLLCAWTEDQGQKVALVSTVLQRLEYKISEAESDLGHAAVEKPVHGDFASLSFMWPSMTQGAKSEDDVQAVHFLGGRIVEDLLSYSFRAVHESSNLLRLLVGCVRLRAGTASSLLGFDVFKEIGNLTFEQLSNLRHRGAFSTVSSTFAICCQSTRLIRHKNDSGKAPSEDLVHDWYKGTLSCIMTQASTTRRSAGIPALMTGILTAKAESPSFQDIFQNLEDIARMSAHASQTDGSNLPQVHALNCLKDIFRSSLLSKKADGHLAGTLRLAGSCLPSEVWAIRNCGLLLLRSLIDTLFGAVDTKASMEAGWDGVTTRIAYRKYPSLPGVLLDLVKSGGRDMMETGSQTTAAEAVFPALDIIRRAGPPEEQRDELYGHICRYLGSHLWHVREMAARTICSFLLTVDWIAEMKDLVRDSLESANKLHGSLLALRFVLERKAEVTTEDAQRVRAEITALVRTARPWRRCPEIRAASLEVDNHLLRRGDARPRAAPGLEAWTSLDPLAGPHSALLTLHQALAEINTMLMHDNVDGLSTCVTALVTSDTNAACKVLEVLPSMWTSLRGPSGHSSLYAIYLTVVSMTEAPDVRAQALVNMAELLDEDVRRQNWHQTPQTKDLSHAWKLLGQGPINPSLSHAILVFSGPLLAIVTRRVDSTDASVSLQILAWAAMMSDALGPEKSFDTRYAAATALKSFAWGTTPQQASQPHLVPFFISLYDALVDDDDEVRDEAAAAVAHLLGRALEPMAAADSLVTWLAEHFGALDAFRWEAVRRVAGQPPHAVSDADVHSQAWVPAEAQLRKAMQRDDSLFAIEEQNLFSEEVRETRRWRGALRLASRGARRHDDAPVAYLRAWTRAGMTCLVQLADDRDDGPLGWTSDQHVFALCARLLLGAATLAQHDSVLGGLLGEFKARTGRNRLHRLLVAMMAED
ncbi:hypothetical protein P8C59_005100 [Phyllachora maydis]|uniref:DUF2428 domain-containing protein n=1 Tax=Phyllachora maydis TaxID=1825666 RepID=A0AAD9MF59_9PEZI|nr:hypothetical protein P8C59_005100 [Phyllachora maydis]